MQNIKGTTFAINVTPITRNQTEQMKFWELTRYYRRFSKYCAKIVWPLHKLVATLKQQCTRPEGNSIATLWSQEWTKLLIF